MSMKVNNCPCCGSSLLRHVRQSEVYWFCKTCWQEVPSLGVTRISDLETVDSKLFRRSVINS